MYAALACYRKTKSFEDIPFLPKIYNSVTKNPETYLNPKKKPEMVRGWWKRNPKTFYKVNVTR